MTDNPHPLWRQERCEFCRDGRALLPQPRPRHAELYIPCAATESAYIAELEAKVAELERDAIPTRRHSDESWRRKVAEAERDKALDTKRLDWIEESKNGPQFGRASKQWFCCYPPVGDLAEGNTARKAIDAAMAEQDAGEGAQK